LLDIGWQFGGEFRFWLLGSGHRKYSLVSFIVAVLIGLLSIAGRIKLPNPILLLFAGIGIGFIPSIPTVSLNSEIIL